MPQDDPDEDIFLNPDDVPPNRSRRPTRQRAQRLQPLPGPYVRVPMQWLTKPHKPCPFRYEERLFLYLLYKSHWGQKEVRVTNGLASEVGVPERAKERAIARLARIGWLRIERREEPSHTIVVIPLVLAG